MTAIRVTGVPDEEEKGANAKEKGKITAEVKVPHEETLQIMAVRGAMLQAQKAPGVWVDV